jgi:mannose-6-phosphate isomerase-like protein (cupin superfamily)
MNKMKGFKTNIENASLGNASFRKVLYTAPHLQLVLMSLLPGEEIGQEIHSGTDQYFRFESGEGKCIIDETVYVIAEGDVIIVPEGSTHNVINTSQEKTLKMYTLYGPPHHKDGIVMATKKEAESRKEEFDGKTTEMIPVMG